MRGAFSAAAGAGRARRVLILVENLPSPFDRRVWQEACTLRDAGYVVSIICPTGPGCEGRFEALDGIHIFRYRLPLEASGAPGYALEYAVALGSSFMLAWRVLLTRMPADERLRRGRRFLVGYVGVMGRQEGIDLLLRAVVAIVLDRGRRDVHFGLVGGGTSLEEMKALAVRLGIADYVTFTGRVPDRELLAGLTTADR